MIGVIGISHKTATVEVREKFSMSDNEIVEFIDSLRNNKRKGRFVVLSTCNRTEVYFNLSNKSRTSNYNSILRKFIKHWNVTEDIKKNFYVFYEKKAVKHLFKVISGMESMVIGEDQIIKQVKHAYSISANNKFTGTILNRLFHMAFEASKKVRKNTKISKGYSSVSSVSGMFLGKLYEDITQKSILLIGAGETGELALKDLKNRGVGKLFISNRTISKAQVLADKYDGTVINYDERENLYSDMDVIIVSTAANCSVIDKKSLESVSKPLAIVDLCVPRNVGTDIAELSNVGLYDIDYLQAIVSKTINERKSDVDKANTIIDGLVNDFMNWNRSQNVYPAVKDVKNKLLGLNSDEVTEFLKKNNKSEYSEDILKEFSQVLAIKYSKVLGKNLKALTNDGHDKELLVFFNNLFDIKK